MAAPIPREASVTIATLEFEVFIASRASTVFGFVLAYKLLLASYLCLLNLIAREI